MDRNNRVGLRANLLLVVPYVGTWIEMPIRLMLLMQNIVVPYVGTWIEMNCRIVFLNHCIVVPYVGTWIEMKKAPTKSKLKWCRSLRGNVDRNPFDHGK